MVPEDDAPTTPATTAADEILPVGGAVPRLGLVGEGAGPGDSTISSTAKGKSVSTESVPTGSAQSGSAQSGAGPEGSAPGESAPLGSRPKDNVVLLKGRRSSGYRPLVIVCVAVVASLAILLVDFRLGAAFLAASVGLALLFRAVLSDKKAGLLVARSRVFDLWFLTVLASALALLAAIVPDPMK